MKTVKLSNEENQILKKLNNGQLHFLQGIKGDNDAQPLKDIVNTLIDIEKNYFFKQNEISAERLFADHAYARGSIASLTKLVRIIIGSGQELARREEERKKRNEEKD